MGKGKGRGSAKATFRYDIQQNIRQAQNDSNHHKRNQPTSSALSNRERPRFIKTGLGQLRNLLRERRSHENYEWTESRRRNGFLPQQQTNTRKDARVTIPDARPLGSLLPTTPGRNNLQTMCIKVLGEYLKHYIEAMGKEQLHAALSMLDSESLALLSVAVSKTCGVDNGLAFCLGSHPHIEALCFRCMSNSIAANSCNNEDPSLCLDNDGLRDLIPSSPDEDSHEIDWEDMDDSDEEENLFATIDTNSTFRLRRLQLVDCPHITAEAVGDFLENSPFLSHLSLSGCLNREDGGIALLEELPYLLPTLQILDLSKCSWVNASMIHNLEQSFISLQRSPPKVYYDNCCQSRDSDRFHQQNDGCVW